MRRHPVQRALIGILELAVLLVITRALPDGLGWLGFVFLFAMAALNLRVMSAVASNDGRSMASALASRASGPSRA